MVEVFRADPESLGCLGHALAFIKHQLNRVNLQAHVVFSNNSSGFFHPGLLLISFSISGCPLQATNSSKSLYVFAALLYLYLFLRRAVGS